MASTERQMVVGGGLGLVVSAAHTALIEHARELAMAAIVQLPEARSQYLTGRFTLGEAYSSDPEQQRVARTVIEYPKALFPEEELLEWSLERAQVFWDSNPKGQPGKRQISGMAMFRFESINGEQGGTIAIRVKLRRAYTQLKDKVTMKRGKSEIAVIGGILAAKRLPQESTHDMNRSTVGPVRRIWPSTKPGPAAAKTG